MIHHFRVASLQGSTLMKKWIFLWKLPSKRFGLQKLQLVSSNHIWKKQPAFLSGTNQFLPLPTSTFKNTGKKVLRTDPLIYNTNWTSLSWLLFGLNLKNYLMLTLYRHYGIFFINEKGWVYNLEVAESQTLQIARVCLGRSFSEE